MLGVSMIAPKVVHADDDIMLATWSRVFINRWVSPARKDLLVRLSDAQGEHIASIRDGRTAVFTILAQNSSRMPDADARKEAEVVAKRHSHAIAVSAHIVEGDGFLAAITRAMLSGINLAVRTPYPVKVFSSVDDSMPWFREQLKTLGWVEDAEGLPEALQSLAAQGWR